MKSTKQLLLVFLSLFLLQSCNKDEDFIQENSKQSQRTEKSYDENVCGTIDELCLKCVDFEIAPDEPTDIVFTNLDGGSGNQRGIDEEYIRLIVGRDEYKIHPAAFYDEKSTEYYLSTPKGDYISTDIDNAFVQSKFEDVRLPKVVEKIRLLDHNAFASGKLTTDYLQEIFGYNSKISMSGKDGFVVEVLDDSGYADPTVLGLAPPCHTTMSEVVLKYKEVLGMNDPHINAEQIIEDAINVVIEEEESGSFNPYTECLNTQSVVAAILDDREIATSSHAPSQIQLNYLDALIGLSDTEYTWLYANGASTNFDIINEVFEGMQEDSNLGNCLDEDCAYREAALAYIRIRMESQSFSGSFSEVSQPILSLYCTEGGECILNTVGPENVYLMADRDAYRASIMNELNLHSDITTLAMDEYVQTGSDPINTRVYYNLYGYGGITQWINGQLVHTRWNVLLNSEESFVYAAGSGWGIYEEPLPAGFNFEGTVREIADLAHVTLECAGLVPIIGEIADGINAVFYFTQGDYVNGSLASAAMVPFFGVTATGALWSRNVLKLVNRGGANVWVSPNGLNYIIDYFGPNGAGSRLSHIFRYAKDIPDRGVPHGVFDNVGDIIGLVDEAWKKVLDNNIPYTIDPRNGNWIYDVPMGRRIGWEGGIPGAGVGVDAEWIRIVVKPNTTDVVTAFPILVP